MNCAVESREAAPRFEFRPGLAGNAWPPIPDPQSACTAAVLIELDRTQWLPSSQLQQRQFEQLAQLARHAIAQVPAYRDRLAALGSLAARTPDASDWSRVPLLARADAQSLGPELRSRALPESHMPTGLLKTSGSTGIPLKVTTTAVTRLLWNAFAMREHFWHKRDFGARLGVIRYMREKDRGREGVVAKDWGAPAAQLRATGDLRALHIEHDVGVQLDWLERERPDLLLTYPSNAVELARHARRAGRSLPPLNELRLFSEVVDAPTREFLRDAYRCAVTDVYSANEVGYIALQCPEHGNYHVQSENVLVEVIDEHGQACQPGQTGRVVLSTLHNFAMPLLRYLSGDHAEVGEPCRCGRGLPVLARILGRTRNMLVLPDGRRHWPVIGFSSFRTIAPVVQHQVVQHTVDDIEVRLVVERPIAPDEEAALAAKVRAALHHNFAIRFSYPGSIERSPTGKYEEFRSMIA